VLAQGRGDRSSDDDGGTDELDAERVRRRRQSGNPVGPTAAVGQTGWVQIPETRFATAGSLHLAYHDWGDGPPLVLIPPIVSNIELAWESELYRRVLEHMGHHLRVVAFDKRGIGLSDRFEEHPTLDQRLGDIAAVMDAVGLERASIMGMSEGGLMAQHFAVRHPERVERLFVVNSFAPIDRADEIRALGEPPITTTPESLARWARIVETWGVDPAVMVDYIAPSQRDNEAFVRWTGRFQRFSATHADFQRQFESVVSVIAAGSSPELISSPTTVVHVLRDQVVNVGHGRVLARLIPHAEYLEIDGDDHYCWLMPNWRDVVDPIIERVTGRPVAMVEERRFAAVLFTDIVGSTETLSRLGDARWREAVEGHDRLATRLIDRHSGRLVKNTGDGLLAMFPTPSGAVRYAQELAHELRELGLTIRAGIHAGEIEVLGNGDITGLCVNIAARVEQAAAEGELLVSSTVRDMLLGSDITTAERGTHTLKGIDGEWRLYRVG
jgi:class 3 adenylate cyclase